MSAGPEAVDGSSSSGEPVWAERMARMSDLMAAQAAYEEADAIKRRAAEVRAEAVRQAVDAGWRYIDVIAKTHLSSASITNMRKGPLDRSAGPSA